MSVIFRWIWKNLKGYRAKYILTMILTVLLSAAALVSPIISGKLVDEVLMGGQTGKLLPYVGIMVGWTLLTTVLGFFSTISYEKCSQAMIFKIKNDLYNNLQFQDEAFFSRIQTGDLMTRFTGDIEMVRHFVAWLVQKAALAAFTFISTTVFGLIVAPLFTLTLLAISPVILITSTILSKKLKKRFRKVREKLSKLNSRAQENIAANRIVKAFAREDYEKEQFDKVNTEFKEASLAANLQWVKTFPVINFMAELLSVICILVGGIFVMNGNMTFGLLTTFTGLTWSLANPMKMLGHFINDYQRFRTSAEKVMELYYNCPTVVNSYDAHTTDDKLEGEVEFKGVSLSLDGREVIKDISFHAKQGATIGIMGETGSGKSTVANLIARLFDPTDGEILIDGKPTNKWDISTLRHNIGLATQDVFLFSSTVDSNISYGDTDISEEEVRRFAHLSGSDFINMLPQKFDTVIGERGVGLSGGQKQRLALARALAIKPAILILDDTTSAVDLETEEFIKNNLRNLDFPCTKFIIASRTSSVKDADEILIMRKGRISERGTHEELIKQNGFYKEVYEIQNK